MSIRKESIMHAELVKRFLDYRWKHLADPHGVIPRPLDQGHRKASAGQSESRCSSGGASPNYRDVGNLLGGQPSRPHSMFRASPWSSIPFDLNKGRALLHHEAQPVPLLDHFLLVLDKVPRPRNLRPSALGVDVVGALRRPPDEGILGLTVIEV